MTTIKRANYQRKDVLPSKVAPSKVYEYIKKIETEGVPRVKAYAEVIDPNIYSHTPQQINMKLEYFKNNYPGYSDLREMVLSEEKEWAMRRSSAVQNKAMDLLCNLIDKANDIATKPDADVKELNLAVSTLKSIMPAFTAVGAKATMDTNTTDKKARASKFIN